MHIYGKSNLWPGEKSELLYVPLYYEYGKVSKPMPCFTKDKVMSTMSLGYNKITIESPVTDEDGKPILKKGKMQPDASKRDTENVPLDEDMDAYFEREVKPYNPDAWIDHDKDKVGYEIPFTRTFYEYEMLPPAQDIAVKIEEREKVLISKLQSLFGKADA